MLLSIRRFHHRCYRQLADKRPKQLQNGTYVYCPADEAMKFYKLRPIQVYIARRRYNIKAYIVKRPVYKLYKEAMRSPGFQPEPSSGETKILTIGWNLEKMVALKEG